MVEIPRAPPSDVLLALWEPDAILPQEMFRPAHYVHECVYAGRRLMLSVAAELAQPGGLVVVRARGIRPLESVRDFGPNLYRPLEEAETEAPPGEPP
ncbi:MAG: hypothetical protein ACYDEN_02440 [Acidimicrobiales bacterium]